MCGPSEIRDGRGHDCGRIYGKPSRQHQWRRAAGQLEFAAGDEHDIETVVRANALHKIWTNQVRSYVLKNLQQVDRNGIWIYKSPSTHDDRTQR